MLAYTHYRFDGRVRREAEALTRRGDKVDFICLRENSQETIRVYNGVNFFPLSVQKYRGNSTGIYLLTYFSFFVRAFFLLTFLQLRRRYDIVQVHTMPDFLVFAALVPKLLGAKIILDMHDLMPELYISKFGVNVNHALIKLITWCERRSVAFAQKAIAVHIPHRDVLVRHGTPKEKFTILLNLPDSKIFSRARNTQRVADGKFRLFYHGTIAKRHGIDVAIRAVALAKKHIANIEFSIIGDGDDRERLVRIVDEMGLSDCVKFSDGPVPLQELPFHIKQADIGIVPILRDSFTRYQLPVKLLEYVGLGIPVISSRTETLEFYFDETMSRYFQPGDEVELASHIVDLYNNPQKREYLISNAERFNKEFSWESQTAVYYDLIDSLCSKTRS
jgi:glycosyltransferase involved in cell wall biosynthesis